MSAAILTLAIIILCFAAGFLACLFVNDPGGGIPLAILVALFGVALSVVSVIDYFS